MTLPYIPACTSFTVADSSGKILRSGSCPAEHFALQARHLGETIYPFKSDPKTQKIVNGVPVPLSS